MMMNKTRQMILLDEDIYQSIQDDIIEQKMRYLGDKIAGICNRFRYEQKKEQKVTTITETISIELKNNLKKELKKLQLCVNNTLKHVQIANDIGQFPPSEFKKKQLLHEVETALIIFSTCCIG